jgi:uncharacterized protein
MVGNSLDIEANADARTLETLSRHRCTGCGECCRWPGWVPLYADDVGRLSRELGLTPEPFLIRNCVVMWWKWDDHPQFRIALAHKSGSNECVLLNGRSCSVHEFKPLKCKAGPADWYWINNPRSFSYYVRMSPSFRHPPGTLGLDEANQLFKATLEAERDACKASSLAALAAGIHVSEKFVKRLQLIEFKEENTMSANPSPNPDPPPGVKLMQISKEVQKETARVLSTNSAVSQERPHRRISRSSRQSK